MRCGPPRRSPSWDGEEPTATSTEAAGMGQPSGSSISERWQEAQAEARGGGDGAVAAAENTAPTPGFQKSTTE